jgi:hypothetical protein
MLTKELICGMELIINTFTECQKEIILYGIVVFLIIVNIRFSGFYFPMLDFGFNNIMLMDIVSMELRVCCIVIMEPDMVLMVTIISILINFWIKTP